MNRARWRTGCRGRTGCNGGTGREDAVGNENKGVMENRVGSGGGKRDVVEEQDRESAIWDLRTDAAYFIFFFPCDAGGSLSVRTRC